MTTSAFLALLQERQINLSLAGDRLRCNAPKGALTADLQAELSRRKTEILGLLKELASKEGGGLPPIARAARTQHMPVSFGQQRLWFLHQFEPESPAYNIVLNIPCKAPVNEEALRRALAEIVRRHEVFRTTFATIDERSVQCIAPSVDVPFRVLDLTNLAGTEMIAAAMRVGQEETMTPFDLARGPLLRCTVLHLSSDIDYLILTQHHIITDGWSLAILRKELEKTYRAFTEGQPSPLPEPGLQYADYAAWQQQWMRGQFLERQLAYWKKQLGGSLPPLELPADRPRPPVQTFRGATQTLSTPKTVSDQIKERGRESGCTLFMMLIAAFKVLLFRYTQQEDMLVGTPNGNRSRVELEDMLGFFVNTQVLRTDLSGNPTFRELLSRVRDVTMEAYAHQDLPFEKLVEELQPERSLSHTPLFQVMFILQNTPLETLMKEVPVKTAEKPRAMPGIAQYDLTLYVIETGNGLDLSFTYNTDLFEDATITRMAEHFQILLEGIAQNPDRKISDLTLLPEWEQKRLLTDWNNTSLDYPKNLCAHELFELQAAKTPDAAAVEDAAGEITYGELLKRVEALSAVLRDWGVGPDTPVGICVERSVDMVVGVLGVMKAGGAYVPLDPGFPRERLEFMVQDAQAPVILTQRALVNDLPPHQAKVLCLDEPLPPVSPTLAAARPAPHHLAYILYTSGSTGKPKGVQIPHQAVVNFLTSMRRQPGLDAGDCLLAITTLSFDIAGLEIYLPLSAGAKLVLASRETAADGPALAALLRQSGATVLQATPATWRLLLEGGWEGDHRLKMLCGGEALSPELAAKLLEFGGELWNMYGPTETTIWSTLEKIEPDSKPILIGRPIANTEIYILDANRNPAPIGVAGELCIGGDGLARGYLNRPELTAEKFIPHPFRPSPARLYRTGDLARYRSDGRIECLGRVDFQVKIRGHRIELGEIEMVLGRAEGVKQAVVAAREDRPGEKRLVAYLSAQDPAPSVSELRRKLAEKLPDYMVPGTFVFLETFPLTPNGKVDRRALPAPDQSRPELEALYEAPRNETEQTISRIWQEVLGLERVGVNDNFFDLGGHSLLLMKVHSKINQVFGGEVPLMEMFRHTTVGALAAFMSQTRQQAQQFDFEKIQARSQKQQARFSYRKPSGHDEKTPSSAASSQT